ncbi:unnamed protein product, partial [Prorocentrum cordatum]
MRAVACRAAGWRGRRLRHAGAACALARVRPAASPALGGPCVRWASVSRPEFEHDDDVAQTTYLRRPGDGGFARRNFVGDTRGRDFHKVYKLTGKQKDGGMAAIRGALHRQTGVPVAVKLVAKSRVQDAKAMLREIEFLKVTDHPNIVRLHETFEDAENMYLVMEYCMGDTLGDRILSRHRDGTGFTEEEVVFFARELLRAVAYCHTQSIVHR